MAIIKIVNDRGDDAQLNLLLTANSVSNLQGITQGVSTPLSELRSDTLSADTIDSGRLYVGYGSLLDPSGNPPAPDGPKYYGWIEFSKLETDTGVWINLTNVDLTALPLALEGKTLDGKAWSLGYKNSISAIIAQLKKEALTGANPNDAYITCSSSQPKIVGPNIKPESYSSYNDYLQTLTQTQTKLIITSDTPTGGQAVTFSGSFLPVEKPDDIIISLKSEAGATFEIRQADFTTEIIYRCDGGHILYNGKEISQNRPIKNPDNGAIIPEAVITNSTFRNLCIGMNEGYFSPTLDNYSANFPCLVPFQNGQGSAYAKIVNETSNSYGFPYADSNLKVLVQASAADPITLIILKDDEAKSYDDQPPDAGNVPQFGNYNFVIGAKSCALGTITIGNCNYEPSSAGAYSGFLPTVTAWTQMQFGQPDHYIWIKCTDAGYVVAGDCFLSPPVWNKINSEHYQLTWGADVQWQPGAKSPDKPKNE